MKAILHNKQEVSYEPTAPTPPAFAGRTDITTVGHIVKYGGEKYIVDEESHKYGYVARCNNHKVKLRGVPYWVPKSEVRVLGRVI